MKKKIVIKLGGSSLENLETQQQLAQLVFGLRRAHHHVVVVHGGGPSINRALRLRGIDWTFVHGQRRTSPEMMEVIDTVLGKEINGEVVRCLQRSGIDAMGLSGADHRIFRCAIADADLGLVGKVHDVWLGSVMRGLAARRVPVIAPIGLASGGQKLNVNADWAAAQLAIALGADDLIFLTDQDGVLDPTGSLIRSATPLDLREQIEAGSISGGMRTKALAMIDALESGVGRVRVLNAGSASLILCRRLVGTSLTKPEPLKPTQQRTVYAQ